MAKAESRSQRVFWRQVVRRNKEVAICVCLLLSSNGLAGTAKTFYHIPGGSTKDTAIAFVEKYDAHLHRGMSLNNLKQYWSDKKLDEFNAVAREITKVSGNRQFVERQRLIDIERTNAKCENAELVDIKTTWKIHRKAKLTYSVKNLCKDWEKPMKRVVAMEYNRDNNHWTIHSIIHSEE